MAYGLAGIGSLTGGLAQGYMQGRQQEFARRMQQSQLLMTQANQAMELYDKMPYGSPQKDAAYQSWMELNDKVTQVMGGKGEQPDSWNTAKHFFGKIPLLNKVIPPPSDAPGGGKVTAADVAQPSSAPGPSMQTPATTELAGVPSASPLAAARAGQVPDVPIPYGTEAWQAPRASESALGTPGSESTVAASPAGSSYNIPIQRVPQQFGTAAGAVPNYGQPELRPYQRMAAMAAPKPPDALGPLIGEVQKFGGDFMSIWNSPQGRTELMQGLQHAQQLGVEDKFLQAMQFIPGANGQMMPVSGGSALGQLIGMKPGETKMMPAQFVMEGIRLGQPENVLKQKLATSEMDLQNLIKEGVPDSDPRMIEKRRDVVGLRWANMTASEKTTAGMAAAGGATYQEAAENLRKREEQERKFRLDDAKTLAEYNSTLTLKREEAFFNARMKGREHLYLKGELNPEAIRTNMTGAQRAETLDEIRNSLITGALQPQKMVQAQGGGGAMVPVDDPTYKAINAEMHRYGYDLDAMRKELGLVKSNVSGAGAAPGGPALPGAIPWAPNP